MVMAESPLYQAVPRVGTVDSVVANIQQLVLDRRLTPGDALPAERELAAQLNVSRSILRESLGILRQRGILEVRPGSGTFVAAPSGEPAADAIRLMLRLEGVSVVELCDVRLLIEPELAARAAERMTPDLRDHLDAAFDRLRATRTDPQGHVAADLEFHAVIAEAADHSAYRAILEAVRAPVHRGMVTGTRLRGAVDESDEQHAAIRDALRAGDPAAARAETRRHLGFVRDYLVRKEITTTDWSSS
jgi:GntR family transcriptional repressor for pyruvate dehydrogenase complex